MRHQHAGLIIYDFPLSYGHIIPPFYNGLVGLEFRPPAWAYVVLVFSLPGPWA